MANLTRSQVLARLDTLAGIGSAHTQTNGKRVSSRVDETTMFVHLLAAIEAVAGVGPGGGGTTVEITEPIGTVMIAVPQVGDMVPVVSAGVQNPGLGGAIFSATASDLNGWPAAAQSVEIVVKLPTTLTDTPTDEAWDLMARSGYMRFDATAPNASRSDTIEGAEFGRGTRIILPRAIALNLRAQARWENGPGDTIPYSDNRPRFQCFFYSQYREPEIINSSLQWGRQLGLGGVTLDLNVGATATTTPWVTLPAVADKYASLFIPAGLGAFTLTAFGRAATDTGNAAGSPMIGFSVDIPAGGGYVSPDQLIHLSALLRGDQQVRFQFSAPAAAAGVLQLITP